MDCEQTRTRSDMRIRAAIEATRQREAAWWSTRLRLLRAALRRLEAA